MQLVLKALVSMAASLLTADMLEALIVHGLARLLKKYPDETAQAILIQIASSWGVELTAEQLPVKKD